MASSGWRCVTNKINSVLKTSIKANDYPNDLMSSSETTEIYQGIKIVDYRTHNGIDQYLVSACCESNGTKFTWEREKTLEKLCQDALLKFWLQVVLSEENISISFTEIESAKVVFTKKLKTWMLQPIASRSDGDDHVAPRSHTHTLTPPKKRPRLFDEKGPSGHCCFESEEQSTLSINKNENKIRCPKSENLFNEPGSDFPTLIKKEIGVNNYLSEYSNVENQQEIFDLIDGLEVPPPHHEIGDVITCTKTISNNSQLNTYWVTWLYVSNETEESLGLSEAELIKHFGPNFQAETECPKFQLHRKKHGPATIREAKTIKKPRSISPRSESGHSDSSTVPPSDSGTFDLGEFRILSDHFTDSACQTDIELDPFACAYCQSRKGEDKRLSSLRQRKSKTESEVKEEPKEKKPLSAAKAEEGEEDDDDLVSIEYEIEKILNYRKVEGTNVDEYYIRWKGFTSHYDTWEPMENLSCCDKALVVFYVDRFGERKQVETELQKLTTTGNFAAAKKLVTPALPPIPEVILEKLSKAAPVTDEEIQMAFKVSKTLRKNGRWTKHKLRKMLLDLIGESGSNGASWTAAAAHDELPMIRHQLLMIESERRKDLILKDLKHWEEKLNSIARGRPEILVENNVDLAGPPSEFKYINDNVLGDGVNFPENALEGCECEDSCVKDKSQCCPGKHEKVLAYNIYKRLRVYPGYPIYECNKRCKCGIECANRVVQDGTISLLGTKLCIFRTKNERGWGVKTLKKIKRGTFVCLYAGEIITSEEAESRGRIYENQLGASYLFDLDYYAEDGDSCPYTIDATKMGNISHFINHSCEPNLCVFNVWADCVDQNLPKLAFFALRDIEKDEELTYDYGSHDDDPAPLPIMAIPDADGEDGEELEDNEMIPLTSSPSKNRLKPATSNGARRACLCGAKTCRKVLF